MITLKKQHRGYDKYESSGAGWLGSIPADGSTMKARYVFREINEKSVNGDETLLSVSEYYGVKPRGDVIDEGDWLTHAESLEGYKRCRKGDLVMNIMLAWKTGLGVSNFDGIVSPAYCVYRPVKKYHSRYLHYLLRTKLYTEEFGKSSTGIIDSRLRLYSDKFYKIPVVSPPLGVQQKIAEYLDEKCALIDDIIEGKEKQIEILEEQHAAIINQAVTKGLDESIEMKQDSTFQKIPAHWNMQRIKDVSVLVKTGTTPSTDDLSHFEGESMWYTPGDFDHFELSDSARKISDAAIQKGECRLFPANSVLLVSIGATLGKVGYAKSDFSCNQQINVIVPAGKVNHKYIAYYFLISQELLRSNSIVTTIGILNQDRLGRIPILVPPKLEQDLIADYLDQKTKSTDFTIERIRSSISVLNEYKTS